MAQYLYETRLSDHLALTPENYLVATACVLCRSGTQQYRMSELNESSNSDELVTVNRPVVEVTNPRFLASLPGKSVTINHPSGMITADSHSWSTRGIVLRAYVGDERDENGNVLILGDIVLHDPSAIQRVLDGQRQLSLGYKYSLAASADGELQMTNLIANHCALVALGRAGNAQIMDTALADGEENIAAKLDELWGNSESEDEIPMPKTKLQTDEDQNARIDRLCALLEMLLASKGANDDSLVPVATLPKSERGENPVVNGLRRMKDAIAATGDCEAINAFNSAMTLAKRGVVAPAQQFIAGYDGNVRAPALSWGDMLAIRGRELRDGKLPSEPTDYKAAAERHALDQKAEPLSYEEQIKRAGERMRNNKFQRD